MVVPPTSTLISIPSKPMPLPNTNQMPTPSALPMPTPVQELMNLDSIAKLVEELDAYVRKRPCVH